MMACRKLPLNNSSYFVIIYYE